MWSHKRRYTFKFIKLYTEEKVKNVPEITQEQQMLEVSFLTVGLGGSEKKGWRDDPER